MQDAKTLLKALPNLEKSSTKMKKIQVSIVILNKKKKAHRQLKNRKTAKSSYLKRKALETQVSG